MEIYERYASLFLHSNATFLCERAHAEVRTAASLEALASCYLRQGAAKRAYAVLCGCASSANGRYLLAVACYKLDKLAEAETALLPDRAAAGPKASRDLLLGPGSPVPHGAAGSTSSASSASTRTGGTTPRLGASVDADAAFDDHAPHAPGTGRRSGSGASSASPPGAAAAAPPARRRRRGRRDAAPVAAGRRRNLFGGPASSARVDDENAPPRRRRGVARAFAAPLDMGTPHQRSACGEDSSSRARSRRSTRRTPWPTRRRRRHRDDQAQGADVRPRRPGSAYDDASSADKPRAKVARRSDAAPPPEAPRDDGAADAPPTTSPTPRRALLGAALLRVLRRLGAARDCIGRTRGPDALRHLHAVPARHFETGWVQHHVGKVHFEAADYEAAVRSLRTMRRVEPHRMAGLELLSTALWHLKDDVELCYLARHCVDFDAEPRGLRAIAVDPRFAYAYTLCGHEYVANEDFEKAIGMYRHAMRIDERHYNAWYGLGAIYYRQEKYELAEYHFDRALCHNPTSSVLHCYLGMTLHANQKRSPSTTSSTSLARRRRALARAASRRDRRRLRAPPRDSAGPGIPAGDVADAEAGAAAAERRFSDTALADARRDALRGGPATPPLSLAKAGGDLICLHWPVREEVWWCGLRVRKVGAMTIVYEWTDRDGAKRRLLLGPYAHFLCLHVLLLCAIAACVYGAVVPASWVAARALGLALAFLALAALAATALADPGVFPRYFTRARPDWTYSEYAHAFRPPGTIFCQECQILVEDYNHFCPWSGTAIGKGNGAFTAALAPSSRASSSTSW
ncbi:hypothetical protein JL722_9919 [Aureococcus anophagefferens]|nr:hypothetical protein JL722_9919 [Aureococcus anophagefferens]